MPFGKLVRSLTTRQEFRRIPTTSSTGARTVDFCSSVPVLQMDGRERCESTNKNELKKRECRGRESPLQNRLECEQYDFVGMPLMKHVPSGNKSNLAALKLGVRISNGGLSYWAEVDTEALSIWVSEGMYLKECESGVAPFPVSVVAADGTCSAKTTLIQPQLIKEVLGVS
jgi:hypothetical protein